MGKQPKATRYNRKESTFGTRQPFVPALTRAFLDVSNDLYFFATQIMRSAFTVGEMTTCWQSQVFEIRGNPIHIWQVCGYFCG
jgi:hypothetical protein